MKEVLSGIYFIRGIDEAMPDSHTYLVGMPDSGDLTLIDPGLMHKGEYKLSEIKRAGIELGNIKRIILTHTHFDHIGALPEIRKELPEAEVWIHRAEAEPLSRGDERHVYGMEMFKSICQGHYGIEDGHFKIEADRELNGDELIHIGGMEWKVIHVPGHSAGSIALYSEALKTLIPGDVIYSDYAIGRFDLFGANARELGQSLKLLSSLDVKILLPGHNNISTGLPIGYIADTLRYWERELS